MGVRRQRRSGCAIVAAGVLLCVFMVVTTPARLVAQLSPPSAGGVVELDRLLQRLGEPRRLLVIAAHPDDEDTEILALAALGQGADAAYLSLSRGEGGQNLIGPELGEVLGLIRSQELVAARDLDGARQFFTRAYDFGFSRSLEETSRFWPPDTLLKDAVRVVRRFKPHVIVSVFTGTPRDGHGHHQAAGVVAHRVFDAAGDPFRFPELSREEGLEPWTPLRLYRSTRFDTAATTIMLETGTLDWRTGRSFHQIAMASRSLHRSQDMGQLQSVGPRSARLQIMADRTARRDGADGPGDLFDGVPRAANWAVTLADSLRGVLNPSRPHEIAPRLAAALRRLNQEGGDDRSRRILEDALAIAAGLVLDARIDRARLVPGQRATLTIELFNGGPFEGALESAVIRAPEGWGVSSDSASSSGRLVSRRFQVQPPANARLTQPYFLERPRTGYLNALYDWSGASPSVKSLPFEPPLLEAEVKVRLLGNSVRLDREVTLRTRDQALGELRHLVRVVPPVEIRLEPDTMVWPASGEPIRPLTVTITSNAAGPVAGSIRLEAGAWPSPSAQPFRLEDAGQMATLAFQLTRPRGVEEDRVAVRAIARLDDGREIDQSVPVLEYQHIRPTPYVRSATSLVRVAPVTLPALRAVGYVRGASDRVPEALTRIGLPVTLLTADDLARGDLSGYDAIVVGARAYEVDSALTRHNQRLLAYVRQGGLLLVQYQQYGFVSGGYAPHSITINRPHDRVTDESAPVRLLLPEHPAFNRPNRIGPGDWEEWPQERGLYFAASWDPAYRPLIELSDPGFPPLRGGLLVARYGEGTYIYAGLAFFRALPAGVPGAFRLFLNLLALE